MIRCTDCGTEMKPRFHFDDLLSDICIDCLRDLLRLMDTNLSERAGLPGPFFKGVDYSGDFPELATYPSAVTEFGYGRIISLGGPLGLSGEEIIDLPLREICMSYWHLWDRDYDEVVVSKEEWEECKPKPTEKPAEPVDESADDVDSFVNIVIMGNPHDDDVVPGLVFLDEPERLDLVVPAQYKELLVKGVALLATGTVEGDKFIAKVIKSMY